MALAWFIFCLTLVARVAADDIEVFVDRQVLHEATGFIFGPFSVRKESPPDTTVAETGRKQEFKNCGGKAQEFQYGWTPKGPLKIGQAYNFSFDATAAYDMATGTAHPVVYFNEYLIFDSIVRFCQLIPKEYKVCPIKKGEKLHVMAEVTLKGKYVQAGRYHGNATVSNEKGQEMLCVVGDVTLS